MKQRFDYLFFIPSGGGGAEKVSINIAHILKKSNKSIHIVFIEGATRNVMKFTPEGISYSLITASSHIKRYIEMFNYIRVYKPKIVFSSLTALSAVLILAKLFFPHIKVITRQCFSPSVGSKPINLTIKVLFRFANKNIAQTDEMRMQMLKTYALPKRKVVTLHNPLNIDDINQKISQLTPISKNYNRFIAIGRLNPQKDYPTLLKAFRIVKYELPNSTLTIFGAPDSAEYLEQLISLSIHLNIQDSVKFNGYTDNPYKELINSNCFVLSSITEGLPNVMLEAMYLNIPCAVTKSIPFIARTIKDGQNGYTAEVGNEKELSIAMIKASKLFGKVNNNTISENNYNEVIKTFSI